MATVKERVNTSELPNENEMWDYFIRINEDGETMFVDEVTEDDFTITLVPDAATIFSDWGVLYDLRKRYPDITFVGIPVSVPNGAGPIGYEKSVG